MQSLRCTTFAIPMPPVAICTLGQFGIARNGVPVCFEGRGPRKPLELLSLLITAGARGTGMGKAADLLWPDADGFDAYRCLITTAHRLRRLLGEHEALNIGAGRVRLDPAVCEVDVWKFEQALAAATDRAQLQAALALYDRPFLEDDMTPWAIGMRTWLEKSIDRALHVHGLPARPPDGSLIPVRIAMAGASRPAG